jgi:hypothetical protein
MKLIASSILFVFLFSCSSTESSEEKNEDPNVSTDTTDLLMEDEESPLRETRSFSLKEFPSVWWMITVEGEEMKLMNYWDSQLQGFEISAETESTGFIDLTYGQDGDAGPLFDFNAEITEGDGLSVIDGSFSFIGNMEQDTTDVTFQYNRLSQCAEFKGMYYSSETFVEDSLKDVFPYIETVREED